MMPALRKEEKRVVLHFSSRPSSLWERLEIIVDGVTGVARLFVAVEENGDVSLDRKQRRVMSRCRASKAIDRSRPRLLSIKSKNKRSDGTRTRTPTQWKESFGDSLAP